MVLPSRTCSQAALTNTLSRAKRKYRDLILYAAPFDPDQTKTHWRGLANWLMQKLRAPTRAHVNSFFEPVMFKVVCLCLALLIPETCSALEIRPIATCSGIILRLRGDILEGDYSRIKSHFRKAGMIIGLDLSSGGGIFEEGLRIANLAHDKKLTVYVADECDSVCALVFFAAAKRFFGARPKIGVHSVSNSRDIEDAGSMLLTVKLARLSAKFGVPHSAIGKMVTTRPKTITYLDQTDLAALDASAGNPFDKKSENAGEAAGKSESCSD